MASEIMVEMNLKMKNIVAESREVAQALNEFADSLKQIEKKYTEPQEMEEEEYEMVDLGNGLFEKRYKVESEVQDAGSD